MELVDVLDSKSSVLGRVGSSPTLETIGKVMMPVGYERSK
jgi:hypothetical protein